jgi:hypothetical protein
MSESKRGPYAGDTKKLLVAVDIGTTFTAVSFSILEPGEPPKFHEVRSRIPRVRRPSTTAPADPEVAEAGSTSGIRPFVD